MNQQKIGQFLKELRNEKGLTQAQLAEMLNVSNRSISRWENGVNMPDLDLLIQIADYYSVEIGEILDGERKNGNMDKKTEETLLKVADYSNNDKMTFSKKIGYFFIAGLIALSIHMVMEFLELPQTGFSGFISGLTLGIGYGTLILGIIYTSGYMAKIRAFKMRLLKREK